MSTLTDTGPLIALIDKGQGDIHRRCVLTLASLSVPLLTTWPCFTEAMYFLAKLGGWDAQKALWAFVERGALRIHSPDAAEVSRTKALMQTYADTPMDLADASLVAAAENQGLDRIFTLDSDFRIYRLGGNRLLQLLP